MTRTASTGRAFLISFLLGGLLLGALPWVLVWLTPGTHSVLPINTGIDATVYQSQYHDIFEGKWIVGDAHFYEHRDDRGIWAPLLFGITGKLAWLLGSMNASLALIWIGGWTVSFFCTLLLLKSFIRSTPWAAAGTLVVLGAEGLIRNPLRIPVDLFVHSQRHAFEMAMLFLTLYLLWRAFSKDSWRAGLLAGIAGGLTTYIYFYHALLFIAGTAAATLFFFRTKWKTGLAAFGTALVLAIPYWLAKRAFDALPSAADFYARMGLLHTRGILLPVQTGIVIAGLVVLLLIARRRLNPFAKVIAGFLLATVGLLNLNVVTGFTLQPGHWFLHSGRALLAMAGVYALGTLRDARPFRAVRAHATWGAIALAAMVVFAGTTQVRTAVQHPDWWTLNPAYADALAWINAQPSPAVVGSIAVRTTMLTTSITDKYSFTGTGGVSLASEREMIERFMLIFRTYGVPPTTVRAFLDTGSSLAEHGSGNIFLFAGKYVFTIDTPDDHPPPPVLDAFVEAYCAIDTRSLLRRYRLDYVVNGPIEQATWNAPFDGRPGFEKAYDRGGVAVYRVQPDAVIIAECPASDT